MPWIILCLCVLVICALISYGIYENGCTQDKIQANRRLEVMVLQQQVEHQYRTSLLQHESIQEALKLLAAKDPMTFQTLFAPAEPDEGQQPLGDLAEAEYIDQRSPGEVNSFDDTLIFDHGIGGFATF